MQDERWSDTQAPQELFSGVRFLKRGERFCHLGEAWKVVDYPGLEESHARSYVSWVSDHGRALNNGGVVRRVRNPSESCEWYPSVKVGPRWNVTLHSLVAHTFLGWPKSGGWSVDHVNRLRGDCRLENLRFATKRLQMVNRDIRTYTFRVPQLYPDLASTVLYLCKFKEVARLLGTTKKMVRYHVLRGTFETEFPGCEVEYVTRPPDEGELREAVAEAENSFVAMSGAERERVHKEALFKRAPRTTLPLPAPSSQLLTGRETSRGYRASAALLALGTLSNEALETLAVEYDLKSTSVCSDVARRVHQEEVFRLVKTYFPDPSTLLENICTSRVKYLKLKDTHPPEERSKLFTDLVVQETGRPYDLCMNLLVQFHKRLVPSVVDGPEQEACASCS